MSSLSILALAWAAWGCSGDSTAGTATLSVLVEPEDVILTGLVPGEDTENVRDGWTVTFDRYLVGLGGVRLRHSADGDSVEANESALVDLKQVQAQGEELFRLEGLASGRWDFGYGVLLEDAVLGPGATQDDLKTFEAEGITYRVIGTLTQAGGVSCPPARVSDVPDGAVKVDTSPSGADCFEAPEVKFDWPVAVEASYFPCEIDGSPGVALSAGQVSVAALSIHGDHLFFNGFPEGTEGGAKRLAQWVADSDLNLDGEVTTAELEAIRPAEILDLQEFPLGGSPITPLDSMLTYVRAQLMTQGHCQGEGECALAGE